MRLPTYRQNQPKNYLNIDLDIDVSIMHLESNKAYKNFPSQWIHFVPKHKK